MSNKSVEQEYLEFIGSTAANYPVLMSARQAAEVLNVTPRTVIKMCDQGKLKAVKVLSVWRINRDELYKFAGLR